MGKLKTVVRRVAPVHAFDKAGDRRTVKLRRSQPLLIVLLGFLVKKLAPIEERKAKNKDLVLLDLSARQEAASMRMKAERQQAASVRLSASLLK